MGILQKNPQTEWILLDPASTVSLFNLAFPALREALDPYLSQEPNSKFACESLGLGPRVQGVRLCAARPRNLVQRRTALEKHIRPDLPIWGVSEDRGP